MTEKAQDKAKNEASRTREERLKAALKKNISRRKTQAKARVTAVTDTGRT